MLGVLKGDHKKYWRGYRDKKRNVIDRDNIEENDKESCAEKN